MKKIRTEATVIPVIIDRSREIGYEIEGKYRKFINSFLVNVLGLLPVKSASLLFSRTSKDGDVVKKNATTHKALEIIYSFDKKIKKDQGLVNGLFTHTWQHLLNSKALRNRLRLVKEQLRLAILSSTNNDEIKILSLGAGSARAIIEVMEEFKNSNIKIKAMLLDKNKEAMDYGQTIAREYDLRRMTENSKELSGSYKYKSAQKFIDVFEQTGNMDKAKEIAENFGEDFDKTISFINEKNLENDLIWVNGSIFDVEKYCKKHDFYPDILEMVGFMDYLDENKSINLLDRIFELLTKKGIFIGCNIKDNRESKFLTKVLGWPMIYKDEEYLKKIINKSSFNNSKIIYEPLMVHGLIVCKK
jgi:hypothetical protein